MRDLNAPGRVTFGRIRICPFRGLSLKVRIARYLLEAENSQNRCPVRNRQREAGRFPPWQKLKGTFWRLRIA